MFINNMDFAPMWWAHTRFGTIVIVMIFLTWSLVIIDLFLISLYIVHKMLGRKEKGEVTIDQIEQIGQSNLTVTEPIVKKPVRNKQVKSRVKITRIQPEQTQE